MLTRTEQGKGECRTTTGNAASSRILALSDDMLLASVCFKTW